MYKIVKYNNLKSYFQLRLSLYFICISCVFCQYGNNEASNQMYNQFDRQNEAPNNYMRDSGGAYNQQQSISYQSDESV